MKSTEPTLRERSGRVYRRLLLLQRLFQFRPENDDAAGHGGDDRAREMAFAAAVREVLDELTEHARLLTSLPFPISEWRPGDTADDTRWRGLTEVERSEVLSLVSAYENLISWAEEVTRRELEATPLGTVSGRSAEPSSRPLPRTTDAADYLKAERARLERFHQDMEFLGRRQTSN